MLGFYIRPPFFLFRVWKGSLDMERAPTLLHASCSARETELLKHIIFKGPHSKVGQFHLFAVEGKCNPFLKEQLQGL